jgi:hypothetical protein
MRGARVAGPGGLCEHGNDPSECASCQGEREPRFAWSFLGLLFFLPVSLVMLVWWLFQKRKG